MDASTPLYQPLNSAKSEVRLLLIIFQDKETNAVHCKLSTASLDTAPQYSALSYEWKLYDEDPERVRVIVNGRQVATTRNLGLALLELAPGRLYWIDAICINQSDVFERGKQVRLMKMIYSQAKLVEIWLGRIEGNSNLGMALLWETNQRAHKETVEGVVKKRLPDLKYQSHWKGICNIMDRSYFTRLWIIQEVVLAQQQDQVMLHCGSCTALWIDLCNIAHCITQIGSRYNWGADSSYEDRTSFDVGKRAPKILALDTHAGNWASNNSLDWSGKKNEHVARQTDLLCLLTDYFRNDVTDYRDKIYGLLGVALEYPGVQLEIDYSLSVEMVYAEAARYMVQGTKRLDILLFCRHWGVESMPSWVPDWRVPYEVQGPHEKWHLEKHDASGGTPAVASFSPDLKFLRVKAILLGPIKSAIPWNHWMRGLTGPNTDGYEKITAAGEIEIFRWITFGISSFDEGELAENNQRPEKEHPIRAVFDALTYGWIGQHALISMWSFEKFFTYYLRLSYKMNKRLGCDIPLWKAETSQILEGIDIKQKLFSLDIRHENTETDSGFPLRRTLGNCHKDAKVGDTVAIVLGCKHPVLLHKKGDKYELTHGLYLYGYMHGEAIGKYNEVDIELI